MLRFQMGGWAAHLDNAKSGKKHLKQGDTKMADLILLTFKDGNVVRCTDLDDAKAKAIGAGEDGVVVEIIPEGKGGLMRTLAFDRNSQEWISA
jgi:hypothetical protein